MKTDNSTECDNCTRHAGARGANRAKRKRSSGRESRGEGPNTRTLAYCRGTIIAGGGEKDLTLGAQLEA